MTKNPVVWFEIYVEDMTRAKTFYESVFQVELNRLDDPNGGPLEMLAFPDDKDSYGACGVLAKMDGRCAGGSGTLVYFACDDCAVEAARAEEFGGRVERGKMPIGEYGFISLVSDTEGNMLGLHSMK